MTTPEQPAVTTAVPRASLVHCGEAPSSPVGRDPTTVEPDDLGWDVPDEDTETDASDDNWNPEDDSDLGLDDDDAEDVGLDTDTGFEEGESDYELDEAGEGERWTTDSEASEDLPGAEADALEGEGEAEAEEYGWTGDDDPNEEPDESLDPEFEESLPNLDDGGAEGVEDDTDLEEFELGGLPDLDASAEEEGEAFGIENIEELAGVSLAEEPTLDVIAGGQSWKLLRASAVRITQIASLPGAPTAMAVSGARLALCAGDHWYLAGNAGLERLTTPATGGRSLALAEFEGRQLMALAAGDGLYLSQDGGRSFERLREADRVSHVGLTKAVGKLRIWGRNQRGALLVSDDLGRSFGPTRLDGNVLAFSADGDRRLYVLVKRGTRTLLGSSSDAGRRWSWADAAEGGQVSEPILIAGRGAAVIAGPGAVLHALSGQAPRAVAPLLHAPAALLDEDDESIVYACVSRDDQTLIARSGTRGNAPPLLIAALPHEQYGVPRRLCAAFADGGFITLHVATDQALLRIEASLDGDDLP
jgi:hypothetical protein